MDQSASYANSGNSVMPPAQPGQQQSYYPVPPTPMPLEPPSGEGSYGNVGSSGSAPPLQSHSSSDSSVYAQSSTVPNNGPQTPHLAHLDSPNHYRAASTPHNEKHEAFVNLSPAHPSPYGSTNGQGHPYWAGQVDPSLCSPMAPPAYGDLQASMGYQDQPHRLPHVHENIPRVPSSNDLSVMYPGLAT